VVAESVRSSGVTERSGSVRKSWSRVSHNRGGLGVGVSDGNGGSDVLDNGGNSGVGMTLLKNYH